MSDLTERVSKAIYEMFESRPHYAQLQMNGILAEELARAALAAMREPDNAILKAGCVALDKPDAQAAIMEATLHPNGSRRIEVARVKMRARWNAMIDAALSVPSEQHQGGGS